MTLCVPAPVFLQPRNWPAPLLDKLLGPRLADHVRSIYGPRLHESMSYGPMTCGDSFLAASFSSLWAMLIVLVAFASGALFSLNRKRIYWVLAGALALSLMDTGVRVFHRLNYAAEYREVMLDRLALQLMVNVIFQLVLPFLTGIALASVISGLTTLAVRIGSRVRRH